MIELKNIGKSYGSHEVLKDLSLQFEKGKISMLLGPSGCGKSTMLMLINHLLKADSGEIYIDGKDIKELSSETLRRNMGYAVQGVGLFPHMRVKDNIALVPKLLHWPKSQRTDRVYEMLELVGLPRTYDNKYPHQLSGGEAQRVGVARALAADPDILLMDEPFGALDPISRSRLQQAFLTIQKKLHKTVVFVTHDVGEAVRMGDHIVILQEGKIIAKGDPISIAKEAEHVAKAFLGNSYTLELLDRYAIGHYETRLKDLKLELLPGRMRSTATCPLDEKTSLRELLSLMLMTKNKGVEVEINGIIYEVDFNALMELFGGETS